MSVSISDPFGVTSDPQMPSLALALDPIEAKKELKRRLPRLSGAGRLRLKAIRVVRYKPGRRCVLEYDVGLLSPEGASRSLTLIGKVRARRSGNESYRLLDDFWDKGFDDQSPDGISVPEPLGVIARFQMWFQRKVAGQTGTELFSGADSVNLARKVAEAAHKLHRTGVPTERRHTMADELRILHECFEKLCGLKPKWAARAHAIAEACDRLGAGVPQPQACGIHRDFYSAQVIIAPDGRLYLIDFDLYCMGDPALDVGNFIGHLTEQSLRETGSPGSFAEAERALEQRFIELVGENCLPAIHAYTTLTLARHLYLSTQLPGREPTTENLFALCEERLGIAPVHRVLQQSLV